jgi:hypothetical protein
MYCSFCWHLHSYTNTNVLDIIGGEQLGRTVENRIQLVDIVGAQETLNAVQEFG